MAPSDIVVPGDKSIAMQPTEPTPTFRIAAFALTVRDLDRMERFYGDAIGLRTMERADGLVRLGAGAHALLELRHDRQAVAASPRDAGLYHAAFLLPTRADLARWVLHATHRGVPIDGAADHGVSEAIYLTDPEGNGVEIASDRPRGEWRWVGGSLAFGRNALDLDTLLRDAGPGRWSGAPDGTTIGHLHLRVGAIPSAERFHAGVLGMTPTARYPGSSFFAADRYHHHIAANIWDSANAGPRAGRAAGLADVEVRVAEAAMIEAVARRAEAAGITADRRGPGLSLRDPWGTSFTLIPSET